MRLTIGDLARLGGVSPRTLRHYDDIGVLAPAEIDRSTGYRYYDLQKLAELRRILVLRDLGLGLDQIRLVLDRAGQPSVDQLRGMLLLREAELTEHLTQEQERLRRIAAQLDALERGDSMRTIDVTTTTTPARRVLETTGIAPGYGSANIGPIFERVVPVVYGVLFAQGGQPGICVAHYDWPDDDGNVAVHVGFDIGDQTLTDTDEVTVVELPALEVASALHLGGMDDITETFEAIVRWIDSMGYRLVGGSRELYHEWHPDDPAKNVTEVQLPFAR